MFCSLLWNWSLTTNLPFSTDTLPTPVCGLVTLTHVLTLTSTTHRATGSQGLRDELIFPKIEKQEVCINHQKPKQRPEQLRIKVVLLGQDTQQVSGDHVRHMLDQNHNWPGVGRSAGETYLVNSNYENKTWAPCNASISSGGRGVR